MMLPVTSLPRVLWQHIASWLQGDKAIIHLRATCRWLRRVEIHKLPRHMERHLTKDRLQSVVSLRHLDIRYHEWVTNEMIKNCTHLEWLDVERSTVTWFPSTLLHLDICGREDVTNEMIQDAFQQVGTRLEWLGVERTTVTWFPSTLRYLDICGCKDITNEMLQRCTRLEWLDASNTTITWFPPTLRHLYIWNRTDITNEMLAHLTNCKIIR